MSAGEGAALLTSSNTADYFFFRKSRVRPLSSCDIQFPRVSWLQNGNPQFVIVVEVKEASSAV